MVGELHKRGHQRVRVMPFMSPSGMHWRCWIAPAALFYRNHGAILQEPAAGAPEDCESQGTAMIARYTSGDDNHYFGWTDAAMDEARDLAEKFIDRFRLLSAGGKDWDYRYAGWYQRLLGISERGWLPCVMSDYAGVSFERVPLTDVRPPEWRRDRDNDPPSLPLPPPGKLAKDYAG
jgi:hypothetical protein